MLQDATLNQKIADDIPSELKGTLTIRSLGWYNYKYMTKVKTCRWKNAAGCMTIMWKSKSSDGNEKSWLRRPARVEPESFTDLIDEDSSHETDHPQPGKTIMSEGLDANYMDIINYAVFALILQE
jgi:hypothetical protein